jgi:hypothetical protein
MSPSLHLVGRISRVLFIFYASNQLCHAIFMILSLVYRQSEILTLMQFCFSCILRKYTLNYYTLHPTRNLQVARRYLMYKLAVYVVVCIRFVEPGSPIIGVSRSDMTCLTALSVMSVYVRVTTRSIVSIHELRCMDQRSGPCHSNQTSLLGGTTQSQSQSDRPRS